MKTQMSEPDNTNICNLVFTTDKNNHCHHFGLANKYCISLFSLNIFYFKWNGIGYIISLCPICFSPSLHTSSQLSVWLFTLRPQTLQACSMCEQKWYGPRLVKSNIRGSSSHTPSQSHMLLGGRRMVAMGCFYHCLHSTQEREQSSRLWG